MFVRVKKVHGRRYAYLVEGKREGSRVRQRVVRYLGPVSAIGFGLPTETFTKQGDTSVDWKKVNEAMLRAPLTFGELSDARTSRFPKVIGGRRQGFMTSGTRERVSGEGEALAIISRDRFRQMFVEVGKGRYRMK